MFWKPILLCVFSLNLLYLLFGSICPSKIFIGMPCPACGMTRAFVLILLGRWNEAWELQPMVGAVMFGAGLFIYLRYIKACNMKYFKICAVVIIMAAFFLFGYRILNNGLSKEPVVYEKNNIAANIIKIINDKGGN